MQTLRAQYPNRNVPGAIICVYDGKAAGLDTDYGRWAIVCEFHGTILPVHTLAEAKTEASTGVAEFCEDCMELEARPA